MEPSHAIELPSQIKDSPIQDESQNQTTETKTDNAALAIGPRRTSRMKTGKSPHSLRLMQYNFDIANKNNSEFIYYSKYKEIGSASSSAKEEKPDSQKSKVSPTTVNKITKAVQEQTP
jgi:hypothetical protein